MLGESLGSVSAIIFVGAALAAFAVGSIPTGFVIAKYYGIDIRKCGSGNIGATNVKRILGARAGALTLTFDVLKGAIPASLCRFFLSGPQAAEIAAVAGAAVIAGHCFSPFLNFKGGKGVATSLGVFTVLAPAQTVFALIVFVAAAKLTGFVSVGSVSSAIALALPILLNIPTPTAAALKATACFAAVLVVWRHKANMVRLLGGKELSHSKMGHQQPEEEGQKTEP